MRVLIFFLTWLPALSLAQASWNIEDVARWPGQTVSLKHGNRVVGTVQVSQATALLSVARRLSDAAGIYVSVILVEGNSPNAFVRNSTGSNVVEVNLGLLRVFGDDIDALAAVIGHEIGHIGRRHLDEKSGRDTLLDIVGLIVGISLDYKIGLKTGASSTLGQTLTTIGGTMVSRKFGSVRNFVCEAGGDLSTAAGAGHSIDRERPPLWVSRRSSYATAVAKRS